MRMVLFGNSGSGKTTLARQCAASMNLAHLDLDCITWKSAGVRCALPESIRQLRGFTATHQRWVVEGCYGDLIEVAATEATELWFLNPGVEACLRNCRARSWEPHKYPTREAQEGNLKALLEWVAQYPTRTDEFSLAAHRAIFDGFTGSKREFKSNAAADRYDQ